MALTAAQVFCRTFNIPHAPRIFKIRTLSSFRCLRSHSSYESDPAPMFVQPEVQELLKKLNKVDLKKVFRHRKDGKKLDVPEYKFMTTNELDKFMKEITEEASRRLQSVPVVQVEPEVNEILSEDRELTGHDESKYVITDITYGCKDKDRLIVVREPNGTLRKAFWEERFRMNQIYFPHPERQLQMPHMFEDTYLKALLEREEYEYVLDRACIQFEPYDSEFHRVTSTVYDHIEEARKFNVLLSTRHYGSFVFYLTWHKRIDNLLLHYFENNRIEDAVLLIKLYHVLHPDAKSAKAEYEDNVKTLQGYIEMDAIKKSLLELALQTCLEIQKQHQIVQDGIKKAHGM